VLSSSFAFSFKSFGCIVLLKWYTGQKESCDRTNCMPLYEWEKDNAHLPDNQHPKERSLECGRSCSSAPVFTCFIYSTAMEWCLLCTPRHYWHRMGAGDAQASSRAGPYL
jgi:hypothetical protein